MIRALRAAAVFLFFVALAPFAHAAEPDLAAPLPQDPKVKIGKLENGLTYWIREHATPPGKVGLWLHVASGSVNEEDPQQGLAHFLEHMAFNGSANFAPGTLVKFFEKLGMRFGADQNAFTSFDQTTYILTLPDTKPETIDSGMMYFADVGYRLSLLPEEIDKERGVVLEEMRVRKGARQRLIEQTLPILLPGSRAANRLPIGKEDVLTNAKQDRIKSYYDKWYRPDISTLIVVGDIKAEEIEKQIAKHFGAWKKPAELAKDLDAGIKPYDTVRAAIVTDKEQARTEVSAVRIGPMRDMKTVGDYRRELVENLGNWIVNRRYDELIQKGTAPYQSAGAGISEFLNVCTYIEAEAGGQPEKWAEMTEGLLVELKRARDHGFLNQELDDAKKATVASAEQAARTEVTRDMHAFLGGMNRDISAKHTPVSAEQELELIRQLLPGITAKEVGEAFKANFSAEARLLLVTMPDKEGLPVPKEEDVLAAAKKVEAMTLEAPVEKERPKDLLAKLPAPGEVSNDQTDKDLKILSVEMRNGVKVHIRSMDFKKDQVLVRLTLPGAELLETAENRGISDAACLAFQQAATRNLSSTDIRDLMTGLNVQVGGGSGRDAVSISIAGSPKDLEKGFQLAYLLLTEGKVETSALKVWKERQLQAIEQARTSVDAQRTENWRDILYAGNPRTKMLTKEQVERITERDAQLWLQDVILKSPIEAAIVGDIAENRALDLAKQYLGSLPKRQKKAGDLDKLRKLDYPKGPVTRTVEVPTITEKAWVLMGWRAYDGTEVEKNRALFVAQQILDDHLREEIREKRSLTYSTGCSNVPGQPYKGGGFVYVAFSADPGKAAEAAKIAKEVVEHFVKVGPTDEEMTTARKQFKVDLEKQQQEPGYWLGVLCDLDYRQRKLKDEKEDVERMSTYPREEVVKVLPKVINDENFLQIIALPRKLAPGEKPPAPAAAGGNGAQQAQIAALLDGLRKALDAKQYDQVITVAETILARLDQAPPEAAAQIAPVKEKIQGLLKEAKDGKAAAGAKEEKKDEGAAKSETPKEEKKEEQAEPAAKSE